MRNIRRTIRDILVKITLIVYPISWEIEDFQRVHNEFTADFIKKIWLAESLKKHIHSKGKGKYQIN